MRSLWVWVILESKNGFLSFAILCFPSGNGYICFMKKLHIIFVLSVMLLPACRQQGPDLGDVQGTITLDGQPLVGATVIFEPKAGGRASKSVTDASGHYQLVYLRDINGAIVGPHKVKIFTATEENPKERIPEHFNKKSTIFVDVGSGTNEHNFNLKSKK
jgi:hypothetical protein